MSFSIAFGSTRSSTNWRTVACTSRCSGVSSKSTGSSVRSRGSRRALPGRSSALVLAAPAPPRSRPEPPGPTPRQKAALVVVSGLPAPKGVAGVIVQALEPSDAAPAARARLRRPGGREVASIFDELPPCGSRRVVPERRRARRRRDGRPGRALRARRRRRRPGAGRSISPAGPLGSRHFRRTGARPRLRARARVGGDGVLPEALPRARVGARLDRRRPTCPRPPAAARAREPSGGRSAAGVRCVMVGPRLLPALRPRRRASFAPAPTGCCAGSGSHGVAITDSVSRRSGASWPSGRPSGPSAPGPTSFCSRTARTPARAIQALVPLARRGLLDEHVRRVLAFRRRLGLDELP